MTEKKLFGDPGEVTPEMLVAKIKHQKQVIDKLVRLAIALTGRTDIIEMLDVVRHESMELLGAENATIYILEPEEKVLRFLSTSTKNLEDITIPLDSGSIAGHTILTQEPLKINDVHAIPPDAGYRFNDSFDRHHNYRTVSVISVPMIQGAGETLGALQVLNKRSGGRVIPFTEYDLEIARALASISAVTIEKTRLGIEAVSRLDEVEEKKQAISNTQELLRHSERLSTIGQLAASVAHEVNSPVTGIINYANFVLRQRRIPRKTRADVEAIKEQAQRVSKIVSNLLDFSRREADVRERFPLNDLIRDTLTFSEHFLSRFHGVNVELKLDDSLEPIYASKVEIQEILLNLIRNAAQAMPNGGALTIETIAISTMRPGYEVRREVVEKLVRLGKSRAERFALIRVADTGVGISPEDMRSIFRPFYTTKGRGEGTGLGLSITRDIVTRNGGMIEVSSKPGRGTTFDVFLPA